MVPAKCLRYVAIPTNWKVGLKNSHHILWPDFSPLNQFALRGSKGWSVINPVNLLKSLVTIDANFSVVPFHQHAADQAIAGRYVQIQETFLAAIFFDWPARTIL
jgi:hypothetical protein